VMSNWRFDIGALLRAMLTSKQRAALKALAHHKEPVVQIGKNGVSAPVIAETKAALLAHELIKVKFSGKEARDDLSALAEGCAAEVIAVVGNVAILFVAHPDKPKIRLPRG
jgi:RNA-binding protein